MMRRAQLISLALSLGIVVPAAAGDLWITCEPGLDVYLDGEFVGVSEEAESGKHLPEISYGGHTLRIEKGGFAPTEFSITVGPASIQIFVGELGPEIKDGLPTATGGEGVEQLVGTIEITSDPREINVKIGSQRILKIQPILTIPGIPVGEHKLWFESSGTVLSDRVLVQALQPSQVRVDFRNQRVAIAGDTTDVQEGDSEAEKEGPRAESDCIEYWVQVMRTGSEEEIEATRSVLEDLGFPHYHQKLITVEDDGVLPVYKLRVGPIPQQNKARHFADLIKHAGFTDVWVAPQECQ